MSKRSSWRGLHELADARTQAREIERLLEELLKEHRSLSAKEIREHSDKLLTDLSDTQQQIESFFDAIEKDIESHRNKLKAEVEYLKRHYMRMKVPPE